MLQFSFPPPQSHVFLGLRVLVGPEPWRPRMILIHLLCGIPYLKRSSSRYVQRTIPGNNDQIAGQLHPYAPEIFAVRFFEDPDYASAAPNIDSSRDIISRKYRFFAFFQWCPSYCRLVVAAVCLTRANLICTRMGIEFWEHPTFFLYSSTTLEFAAIIFITMAGSKK